MTWRAGDELYMAADTRGIWKVRVTQVFSHTARVVDVEVIKPVLSEYRKWPGRACWVEKLFRTLRAAIQENTRELEEYKVTLVKNYDRDLRRADEHLAALAAYGEDT
jgi:hypothetical protein